MEYQRQLLAELMNPLIPNQKSDFRRAQICKHHLVAFCPFEQFVHTKADIGRCSLIHDDSLQKDYQSIDFEEQEKLGYASDTYNLFIKLVNDLDRLIKKGNYRVDPNAKPENEVNVREDLREQICILEEAIRAKQATIIALGEAGQVRQGYEWAIRAEKNQHDLDVLRATDPSHPSYRSEKLLEICEMCGALLANDNNTVRMESHMTGKQHNGYIKVREFIKSYQKTHALASKLQEPEVRHGDEFARDRPKDAKRPSRDSSREMSRGESREMPRGNERWERGHQPDSRHDRHDSRDGRGYRGRDSRDSRDSRYQRDDRDRRR